MRVLTHLFDRLTGHRRVTLTENDRVLVLETGRITAMLGPGEHRIRRRDTELEWHDLAGVHFVSMFERPLFRDHPELAAAHLTEVRTGAHEVAVVLNDGRPHCVVGADHRLVVWTDAGPWAVERHDVTEVAPVPETLARRLTKAGLTSGLTGFDVPEGHVGILSVDGEIDRVLTAGRHVFWATSRVLTVKRVDLRWRAHEVTGHEILTRDRVTLRVNLTATFRVVDPDRAVRAVKDFEEALHRAIALAFRRALGTLTLDRLLADKAAVDAEAAETVRAEMAGIGIELGEIALKDVILPGEMREILNRVVAAEKEAEANVIRRREETNATRSLLNTAKVMAENPVMLRLKELEALEAIAGKVERLTVHNGTEGLMTDIVRLRD